jgi:signal transduction histidine kinase
VSVAIEDDGPGIPAEQRQLVFERFWQADSSRSGSHAGLGLSIARSITQVHGGVIEAQRARSGGCRMVALLPAAT